MTIMVMELGKLGMRMMRDGLFSDQREESSFLYTLLIAMMC